MGFISTEQAFQRFTTAGSNSSHFVWFLANLRFFETSNGWIFGFREVGEVFLFAFEPLEPRTPEASPPSAAAFRSAWSEILRELRPKISLFVSVYEPFMEVLRAENFQILQVGKEPYVALADCVPTGKSGKGVRAARNQAVRSGVSVKEWTKEQILAHPTMERDMGRVLKLWKSRNAVDMGGFVNAVDPFAKMECRRYFLAFTEETGLEAFLVATPIPGRESFFLEDLVICPGATRGTGELLTLEAMIALAESNAKMASLGVVSLTSVNEDSAYNLHGVARWALVTVPKYLTKFYNVGGLEMFRKRFKPHRWENIFLALHYEKSASGSDLGAWLKALFALVKSFRPRLNISASWVYHSLSRPIQKHPVSYGVATLASLSFWVINRGGRLPDWALSRFGFYGGAPLVEWPWRSLTSDFLFFDLSHYAISVVLLFCLLRWMEQLHRTKFVALFWLGTALFDDFINQAVLVYPYQYFQPKLFLNLISIKDVGPSLWIATFTGLQVCSLRRGREILFAALSLGTVLCFAFGSAHISNLILNLNHFLFLTLGFVAGKLKFEYERKVSRQVCRMKAPEQKKDPQLGKRAA